MEAKRKQTVNTQTTKAISNFLFMGSEFQQTKQFGVLQGVDSHGNVIIGRSLLFSKNKKYAKEKDLLHRFCQSLFYSLARTSEVILSWIRREALNLHTANNISGERVQGKPFLLDFGTHKRWMYHQDNPPVCVVTGWNTYWKENKKFWLCMPHLYINLQGQRSEISVYEIWPHQLIFSYIWFIYGLH